MYHIYTLDNYINNTSSTNCIVSEDYYANQRGLTALTEFDIFLRCVEIYSRIFANSFCMMDLHE